MVNDMNTKKGKKIGAMMPATMGDKQSWRWEERRHPKFRERWESVTGTKFAEEPDSCSGSTNDQQGSLGSVTGSETPCHSL